MSCPRGGIDTSPRQNFIWRRARRVSGVYRLRRSSALYSNLNHLGSTVVPYTMGFRTQSSTLGRFPCWRKGSSCIPCHPRVGHGRHYLALTNISFLPFCHVNNMYLSRPVYSTANAPSQRWDLGDSDSIVRNDEISDPIISFLHDLLA
jgi:hypothetical protein